MKSVLAVHDYPHQHWVGDGFAVQSMYAHLNFTQQISPFLMLDYAAPRHFSPSSQPRGVGGHPHRGFETVTIVYRGEVEHRDSTGGGGVIRAGDVQWMTAGSGLVHDEFHSKAFTASGGDMEMVQLWVNLPAEHKMTPPRYQAITSNQIPEVELENEAGHVRIIAGAFAGQSGPASTFTPINVWDLRLARDGVSHLDAPDGHNTTLLLLSGKLRLSGHDEVVQGPRLVQLSERGAGLELTALEDSTALLLSGEPIDEAIASYGPFVMNTQAQIAEAIEDFNSGAFGRLPQG